MSKYERILERMFEQEREIGLLKATMSSQKEKIGELERFNNDAVKALSKLETATTTFLKQSEELQVMSRESNAHLKESLVAFQSKILRQDERIEQLSATIEAMKSTLRPIEISQDMLDEWINGALPKDGV